MNKLFVKQFQQDKLINCDLNLTINLSRRINHLAYKVRANRIKNINVFRANRFETFGRGDRVAINNLRRDQLGMQRLIAPMLAVLAGLAALLLVLLFYSANSMNQSASQAQRALINNALSLRLVQSLSELRSVAWWDEMVVKSRGSGLDAEWLDVEVGVFVTTSYKHDRILVLDAQNRPIYGFGADERLDQETQEQFARLVLPLATQIRGGKNISPRITDASFTENMDEDSAITDRSYGRGAAAILSNEGRPVFAAAMEITPSLEKALGSKRPHILVSITDVNAGVLRDMGRSVLIGDLKYGAHGVLSADTFPMRSDDGKSMGSLTWTPKQPGNKLISDLLPVMLIVLIAAMASIAALFKRLIGSTQQLAKREIEAQYLANHDALTSLPNRRMLAARLEELRNEHDPKRTSVSVACIDLDRFKDINDTLGHQAGDELIKAVARRIESRILPGDMIARLGGDELAVIRLHQHVNEGERLAKMVLDSFDAPFSVIGHEIETKASLGVTSATLDRPFDDIMREADIALYEAKAMGRGRAAHFVTPMAAKLEKRHSIEIDLRRAIANRELTLNYQPIIEAATGRISSVEALVRWYSATHGQVSPEIFVGIAEETGMMAGLGHFIIERAMEDSQRWPHLATAINISPAQLRSVTIVSELVSAAKRFGVSPAMITIEITETLLMANDARTLKILNQLKEHGFSLALDDFGTGYSSLAYIRDFPFDRLKIDRRFIKGVDQDPQAQAIVEGIVNFGRILGHEIIAEGIETEQEMQAMQRAGCTHLQGFAFSKPLSADHIEALSNISSRLAAKRDRSPIAKIKSFDQHQRKKSVG
jgi:diguanylate cyclase (GGDEF)-like protein